MEYEFKFGLNDAVAIDVSNESGVVIGRAEYRTSTYRYLVRYKAADGRAVEAWWDAAALAPAAI